MGGRAKLSKWGWTWFGVAFACFVFSCLLGWFDTSTTLVPDDSGALEIAFFVACVLAATAAIFVFWQSSGGWLSRAVLCLFVGPLFTFLGVFLLLSEATTLIANRIDFPKAQSRRSTEIIQIDRAYETQGKGRSWNIQTMPIWSNIDVTQTDYQFMLDHRRPDDQRTDSSEIASKGYFCAKVEIERAGGAIRILHAGRWALPHGSVGLCSARTTARPVVE